MHKDVEKELLRISRKLKHCENVNIQLYDDSITLEYDYKHNHYVLEYVMDGDGITLWNNLKY